jgi:hypothetical protein
MDAIAVAEAMPSLPSNEDPKGTDNALHQVPEGENKFQKAIAAWRGRHESLSIAQRPCSPFLQASTSSP